MASQARIKGGCMHAMEPEQQKKYTDALQAVAAHTVHVTIGSCQPGNFALAVLVLVDGKETIRGGLNAGEDGKFVDMIRAKAKASGSEVVLNPKNNTPGFVVPCPPG